MILRLIWLYMKYTAEDSLVILHEIAISVNQLPQLSARWLPGTFRGFRCGQAVLGSIPYTWMANPHNPAMSPHSTVGTHHTD